MAVPPSHTTCDAAVGTLLTTLAIASLAVLDEATASLS